MALVALGGALAWGAAALSLRTREVAVTLLSAAVGRDVAVGQVSGDPWGGLVLADVALMGRAPGEPLLTVRRLTLFFDPRSLAADLLRGRGAARSLTKVILEDPVLHLERDSSGRWNVAEMAGPLRPAGPPGFAGRVIVLGGEVLLVDRQGPSPHPFRTRFIDISGSLDAGRPGRPVIRLSFVEARGDRRVPGRVRGALGPTPGTLDLDVEATGLDLAAWGPYLLRASALRLTGGLADVTLHVLRTATRGPPVTDYSGRVVLHGAHASIPRRGLVVRDARGTLIFANGWVRSPGLKGTINGSPLEVRGEASIFGEPHVDLIARSPAVDLAALWRAVVPSAPPRIAGVAAGEVHLIGPARYLRMEGHVARAHGRIRDQAFDGASARIALYGQVVWLSEVRARAAGGTLSGDGWWRIGAPEWRVALGIEGADATALRPWVSAALPPLGGRLSGALVAVGSGADLAVAGRASAAGLETPAGRLDAVEALFGADARTVTLDHVAIRQGPAWAMLWGRIDRSGRLALEGTGGALDLAALPLPHAARGLSGPAQFAGRLSGTLAAPAWSGTVLVREGALAGHPFDAISGRLSLTSGTLALEGLTARLGRARYQASGTIRWQKASHLELDLEAAGAPLALLGRAFGVPGAAAGLVDGRVRVQGSPSAPAAVGSLVLRDGSVQGQPVDHAAADFRWDGQRLIVERAAFRHGISQVHLTGSIDRWSGFALDLSAPGLDLRDLALPAIGPTRIEGRVDASGRLTGLPGAPALAVSIASRSLAINAIRFDEASGTLRWEARTFRFDPLALRLGQERYAINGEVALGAPPRATLTATVSEGRLSTLLGLAGVRLDVPLDATISGVASMDGLLANPAARLDLDLTEGRWGDHAISEGHADVILRDGSVNIQELDLRIGQGRIAATGRYDPRGESQVEVSGAGLDLDILRPAFRLRRPLVGRLDFTTQLGGTLASPEIGFALEVTGGGLPGVTFDSLVANAFYRDGILQIPQAMLAQGGHRLRASGSVPFNPALRRFDERRPMDLRLRLAEVNLGLLRLLTERVDEATGAVAGEVRINGTVADPRLVGEVTVRDGRVRLRGLQTPVDDVRLALRFDRDVVRVTEGTARLGGGLARLEGGVRLIPVPGRLLTLVASEDAPLTLHGADLRLAVPPLLDARLTGSVRLWGSPGDPRRPLTLDGRVVLADGTVSVVGRAGPTRADPAALVFRGLRLEAGSHLAVLVGGLRFDLAPESGLVLTGTLRTPRLEGTLEAQRGSVMALGTLFDLREGTATFNPHLGIYPTVLAQAEAQVGPTRVFLTVRGLAPDGLALDLKSDPDLSRAEIVALLGRHVGITRLLSGDIEAALRAEISRRLFGQVGLAVGRALGLSELVIEYDFGGPLALRAGKLLLSNLYLTAQALVYPDRFQWAWALEYRFARGWQFSLRGDAGGVRDAMLFHTIRF